MGFVVDVGLRCLQDWLRAGEFEKCRSLSLRLLEVEPYHADLNLMLVQVSEQLEGPQAARGVARTRMALFREAQLTPPPEQRWLARGQTRFDVWVTCSAKWLHDRAVSPHIPCNSTVMGRGPSPRAGKTTTPGSSSVGARSIAAGAAESAAARRTTEHQETKPITAHTTAFTPNRRTRVRSMRTLLGRSRNWKRHATKRGLAVIASASSSAWLHGVIAAMGETVT